MKQALRAFLFLSFYSMSIRAQNSVPHQWIDETLFCIRNDFARPPIHARNLHHVSMVMHDAYYAYVPNSNLMLLGNDLHGFSVPFLGVSQPDNILAAQNMAISYAAFRLLAWRFQAAPGAALIFNALNAKMNALGYPTNFSSTDYVNDGPAALGNYIAQQIITYGLQDGSNEANNFANQYYMDSNPPIEPEFPGNPSMIDPNRFQQISLSNAIDQAGNPIFGTPPALAPEWGNVNPFALKLEDSEVLERDGEFYKVYYNPEAPPYLDTNVQSGIEDFFKWNFLMVSVWQSHLDTTDNVMWDISPGAIGNLIMDDYPQTWADYNTFYDFYDGGDISPGHLLNPVTNQPYEPQVVRRGDYARVLAEFWADGIDSETPPGHWFDIYNTVSQHPLFEWKWKGEGNPLSQTEYDVKAYLLLGAAMHDAAIGAWAVKGYYDYVRPVSAIRYMADKGQSSDSLFPNYDPAGLPIIPGFVEQVLLGDDLSGINNEHLYKIKLYTWRGHDFVDDPEEDMAGVGWILAENWWPYQRPTFVTPPFAGYVSGHSTFSRAAAKVMDFMTGSPFFPGGMSNFVAEQNDFLEFEIGPSETVVLQWGTYYDASDQCSLSRIWGGIHPPIDDIPGRKIGQQVGINTSEMTDSLFAITKPEVTTAIFSIDTINLSAIGQNTTLSIVFDQNMLLDSFPLVIFPNHPTIDAVLGIVSQTWVSAFEFNIVYEIQNTEVEWGSVVYSISNAYGANAYRQKPKLLSNDLFIDTKLPVIADWSVSTAFINASTSSFCITLTFDEGCNQNIAPDLEWIGAPNINDALVADVNASIWISDYVYQACYNVDVNSLPGAGELSVVVSNLEDLYENSIIDSTLISLILFDLIQPQISLAVSNPILNINAIGNNAFSVILESDKIMQTNILPTLIFSSAGNIIPVLDLNTFLSSWLNDTICQLVYNLQNTPIDYSQVDIEVSNVFDLINNIPVQILFENQFVLDTERPSIDGFTLNYEVINVAAAQNGDYFIDITFSEMMNTTTFTPLVAVLDALGAAVPGVNYNIFSSAWQDALTFRAAFTVSSENIEMDNLQLRVSLARDLANNAMLLYDSLYFSNLDTRSPQLISFEISENVLGQENISVEITVGFDEPMNDSYIPHFSGFNDTLSYEIFTPVEFEGLWVDAYTYSGIYTVNHIYFQGTLGLQPNNARDMASNLVKDTVLLNALEVDFIYLNLEDIADESILFYPNPAQNDQWITLQLPNVKSDYSMSLLDVSGKIIQDIEFFKLQDNAFQFKLVNLSGGMYFLKIQGGEQNSVLKLHLR